MNAYPKEWEDRALGCFLGQVAGDSLGSLAEFRSPEEIRAAWPDGVRRLADGGAWGTLAGQPTDDFRNGAHAGPPSGARSGI